METILGESQPLLQKSSPTVADFPINDRPDIVVDFDQDGDPDNPLEWPNIYKWSIIGLLAFMAFTVTFTAISVVPIANMIIADLENGNLNKSSSVLLVTIWELGEAAGPLLIAPMSEVFGRYPVINGANLLFVAATAAAALAPSTHLLIAARFFTGLAVASNVLNPAIVGDVFVSEQRGAAMSLVMLTPLIGGAIGPAISGTLAETIGWRGILWISAGVMGVCELAYLTLSRETYKVTILSRRAKKLRREMADVTVKTIYEAEAALDKASVWESILRPAIVLYSSGVLQVISLIGGVAYAYFYIMSTSLPDILEEVYGLGPAMCGLSFTCFSLGSAVGVVFCNRYLDRLFIHLRDKNQGKGLPEYRLPLSIAGSFLFPVVIALYGWVAEKHFHLASELTVTGLWGLCLILAELPLAAYVVDAFGLYSASAMTAMIVVRCLMSTFLPMTTNPLVERLGYGWGMSIFAAFTLMIAPVTVFTMRYGAVWRQRSRYSRGFD